MDPDREWATWQGWLGDDAEGRTIYGEVVEMTMLRKIWNGFAIIVNQSPEVAQGNGTFAWWVRWNYARSMGSAVRRQVDVRDDVVSLGRLIDQVWRYPTVATRERFRSLQGGGMDELADHWFDELAGSGDFINPEIPAQDMEDLRAKTATIRGWVNKAVAHADATGRDAPPLADVHASVDVIFDLFNKYGNLIRGVSVERDPLLSNWATVFRFPWITDDRWGDVARRVNDAGRE